MFVAHLPAGYLCANVLWRRFNGTDLSSRQFVGAAMLGAIAPDTDFIMAYLSPDPLPNHHLYWTHWPIFWLSLLAVSMAGRFMQRRGRFWPLAAIFSINGFIHLVLDSIVGRIYWLAPLQMQPYSLFTVPVRHEPIWMNHLLHWSAGTELAILSVALLIWIDRGMNMPSIEVSND